MKTTLLFLLMAFATSLNAQIVNIPDQNFKYALLHHTFFGGAVIDTNGDGEIQVSEAQAVTVLSVGDPWVSFHIQDLTGIQAFVNITALNVWNNSLTYMDLSQNTALEILYCSDNQISILNLSQNTALKELHCNQNNLTTLNLGQNINLEILYCQDNNITNLDLGQNLLLEDLKCEYNQIMKLDLSKNIGLSYVILNNNHLTDLDIRNGNNVNIAYFTSENNPYLSCVFVDNATYSQTNNYWHKDTASIYVETQAECDAVVGVEDFFLEQIKIYPIPVENELHILLPTRGYKNPILNITDVVGKILLKSRLQIPNSEINVSSLQKGIYFLRIFNNQSKLLTKKIIKL